ncbi:HigA family addiction module antitoxin [Aeromonas rivipollensis]|uniref:HigA family addiction module antitoxin n=1 Tax=Aeromonas TaxID=642 RepID=UPI000FB03C0A
MTEKRIRKPTHPGLVFKRRVLARLGLSIQQAADYLGLSRQTMSKFCNGTSPCTQNLARRIAEATGSNVAVWINMQAALDAWEAENMETPVVTKFPVKDAA